MNECTQVDLLKARFAAVLGDGRVQSEYPIEDYVDRIELFQGSALYHQFPVSVLEQQLAIAAHGVEAIDAYHRLVLLYLIEHPRPRHVLPLSVAAILKKEIDQIMHMIGHAPVGFFLMTNPRFVTYLAICRQRLLPCGAEDVDVCGGLPRSKLLRAGPRALLYCALDAGGIFGRMTPFYESHWSRRLAKNFNAREYERFYFRVASLLAANPHMRGLVTASWWLDPAVERISPELAFLRQLPLSAGARLFRIGASELMTGYALQSAHRRRLYESGKYQPVEYMLMWGRYDMLKWARGGAAVRARDFAHGARTNNA